MNHMLRLAAFARRYISIFATGTMLMMVSSIATAEERLYDIQDYRLSIKPDFAARRISVTATITIANPQLRDTFSFGLNDRYDSVNVSANISSLAISRTDDEITITTKQPASQVILTFQLSGSPGRSGGEPCEVVADSSLFLLWSDRFYPIDFSDWATVQTTIILPANFQVIAPGKLITTRKVGDQLEYVFATTKPTVCFSVFADSRWIKSERESNDLRLQTLLHPESQRFAEQIFTTSGEILKYYAEAYCAYPFEQFSFVTINGMYARRAFPGFVGYTPQYLQKEFTTTGHNAHETALLRWCYTIRGNGPGSYQWTEGFGDYAELLYGEKYQKPRSCSSSDSVFAPFPCRSSSRLLRKVADNRSNGGAKNVWKEEVFPVWF